MTHIIGLAGVARAGKDSLAEVLVTKHGYTRIAFADALRDILYRLNPIVEDYINDDELATVRLADYVDSQGWEGAKKAPEVRRLMQEIGVAVRAYDPEFWVFNVMDKFAEDTNQHYVVTDVRFPNEVNAIEAWGGTVYRVERDGAGIGDHATETALDGFDLTPLDNNGTLEDLEMVADAIAFLDDND